VAGLSRSAVRTGHSGDSVIKMKRLVAQPEVIVSTRLDPLAAGKAQQMLANPIHECRHPRLGELRSARFGTDVLENWIPFLPSTVQSARARFACSVVQCRASSATRPQSCPVTTILRDGIVNSARPAAASTFNGVDA
jgi:hypothetical protein